MVIGDNVGVGIAAGWLVTGAGTGTVPAGAVVTGGAAVVAAGAVEVTAGLEVVAGAVVVAAGAHPDRIGTIIRATNISAINQILTFILSS